VFVVTLTPMEPFSDITFFVRCVSMRRRVAATSVAAVCR
jgi:hypothetical protein